MNIKAGDLFANNGQLQHKLRTEADLIRYIQTREKETANYCLFLGAGASVTSKIRTASTLINEWIIELYERFEDKKIDNIDEAKEYFIKNHASWYNPSNPYSSLFEKKYDLPPQRRRFIEQEVDDKLPSIGYAYLISLIEKNFFNTIFTTNFDDLINEAFYQYSSKRPVYCAHDSSIHSVSITSKRPKIIKLHGDYLFDDIKSSLKETESLEHNMKEKFKEFCKEFGLIFIGYSGNDRSIMDILEFLIKQDNYLKNGVYWCLRKEDTINHTLINFLWKEKIYPVIIDGFDEFLAKAHNELLCSGLDIGSTAKNSKLQTTIERIIEDEFKLSHNSIINNAIRQLKESNNRHDISGFINDLSKDDDAELPLPDLRNLLEVEDLLNKKEFSNAYELCEEYLKVSSLDVVKSKYFSKLIQISDRMGKKQTAIYWSDRLIELDPNNLLFLFKKAHCLTDLKEKFKFLNGLIEKHSCQYRLYNEVISQGFLYYKNDPEFSGIDLDELIKKADKSLKLNPALENYAWDLKLRILEFIKKNEIKDKKHEKIDSQIDAQIEKAVACNPEHIGTLTMQVRRAIEKKDMVSAKGLITELYKKIEKSSKNMRSSVLDLADDLISSLYDFDPNDGYKSIQKDFYEHRSDDEEIKSNSGILLSKASYYIGQEKDFSLAKKYFKQAISCADILSNLNTALELSYIFDNECLKKIQCDLTDKQWDYNPRSFNMYEAELQIRNEKYQEAIASYETAYKNGIGLRLYLLNKSFTLLKMKEYEQVIDLYKRYENMTQTISLKEFIINFQVAAKELKSKYFDKILLRNLYAHTSSTDVKICAYSLLGQDRDAKRLISQKIESNYLYYYRFKRWPAISPELLINFSSKEAAA